MELGLKGKVALVTGSSRGIGRGVALALAAEGCDVMLTGRDAKALEEVAAAIRAMGRRAAIAVLDLRETDAPEKLIEQVKREFGGLDILVNNAGATKRGDFLALTDADWEDGYALKFFAHVRLARAAWPLLKERRGSLIAIGGTGGRKPTARVHHRQLRSMPRSPPSPNASPTAARRTACRSTASIRAWSRPTGCGGASRPRWSAPAGRRTRRARKCAAASASPASARSRMSADLVTFLVSSRATWLHGATIDLDGGEIPVL